MGILEKNKGVTQIIKYEAPSDEESRANNSEEKDTNRIFIWKHPCEDFNTMTQLIVHESQEALFFMNGQALDLFGPGRHTLETQNIPLIKKAMNWGTNGETPFHCEVYFINLVEQMAVKWGTDSQVEYMDPVYHFPLSIGASGEMRLQVSDSRKLLIKLLGTKTELNQHALVSYFREILNLRVKTYMAEMMSEPENSIFTVDKRLEAISENLQSRLKEDFWEYGVALKKFIVARIQKPEDRNFQRFKELHYASYMNVAEAQLKQKVDLIEQETQKQKTILEAQGVAEKRRLEGYSYQDERGFDVAEKLVQNEAVGEFANVGMGMGMMAGLGGGIGFKVADMTVKTMQETVAPKEQVSQTNNTMGNSMADFEQKIQKLKMLKEAGMITEEEMKAEKEKLLAMI